MKRSSSLSFVISLIIYSLLVWGGFQLSKLQIPQKTEELKVVPVSLSMFELEPEKPVVEPAPEPKPIEKPLEPEVKPEPPEPAVVKKVEPKKPEPKKEIKKKPKPKPVPKPEPKPVKKVEKKPQVEPKKTVAEPEPVVEKTPVPVPVQKQVQIAEPKYSPTQVANAEQHYLNDLRKEIVKYAQDTYPRRAKRRRWQGEVKIEFKLMPNGSITALKILETSGRSILDQAALEIFQDRMNNHFKPFPKEIDKDSWVISVPVTYHLK